MLSSLTVLLGDRNGIRSARSCSNNCQKFTFVSTELTGVTLEKWPVKQNLTVVAIVVVVAKKRNKQETKMAEKLKPTTSWSRLRQNAQRLVLRLKGLVLIPDIPRPISSVH